jgi:hypothetical protein
MIIIEEINSNHLKGKPELNGNLTMYLVDLKKLYTHKLQTKKQDFLLNFKFPTKLAPKIVGDPIY